MIVKLYNTLYQTKLKSYMLRFSSLIIKSTLQRNLQAKFSKIIKLAPRKIIQNTSQQIQRSLKQGKELLRKYCSYKFQNANNQNQSYQQKIQHFINLINNIDTYSIKNQTFSNQEIIFSLISKLKTQKIFTNGIQIIAQQKDYTKQQRTYLTNLFIVVGELFLQSFYFKKNHIIDIEFFKSFVQTYNRYLIILDLNPQLITNYIKVTNSSISWKVTDSQRLFYINQKIAIDKLIQNINSYSLTNQNIHSWISYLSLTNAISNYPSKYYQVVNLLLDKLDFKWQSLTYFKQKYKFIGSLQYLNVNSKKLTRSFMMVMKQYPNHKNCKRITLALKAYLNLNPQLYCNKEPPQFIIITLTNLCQFIKRSKNVGTQNRSYNRQKNVGTQNKSENRSQNKDQTIEVKQIKQDIQFQIYKTIVPTLMRASLWNQNFWFTFLDWLDTGKNLKKLRVIDVFTLYDLITIDHDIIPEKILKRIQKSKQAQLSLNAFRIEDIDLVKTYWAHYGGEGKQNYTVQQQISNNLRSISRCKVKSQVLIHFFIVDVLMDQNIVIQINNLNHYVYFAEENKHVMNLKSAFRQRIIQKLGYRFLSVDVDTFSEGNYQFLSKIQQYFGKVI